MRYFLTGALILLLGAPTWAGGSKDDYARAVALRQAADSARLGEELRAFVWGAGGNLAAQIRTSDGTRFVHVDPKTGQKTDAFDHEIVAKALATILKTDVEPSKLPIRLVTLTGDAVIGLARATAVSISLESSAIKALQPETVKALRLPPTRKRKSPARGGGETEVRFFNATKGPIDYVWLDSEARPHRYGSVGPGKTAIQHTYAGHVWRVTTKDGKRITEYVAHAAPRVAYVDGSDAEKTLEEILARTVVRIDPDFDQFLILKDHNVSISDGKPREMYPLTRTGTKEDPYVLDRAQWSPTRAHVMIQRRRPPERRKVTVVNSVPKDRFQPLQKSFRYRKPGDRIAQPRPHLFEVKTKERIEFPEDLFDTPWAINHFSWSQDGTRFRFLYNERGHQVMRLIELDVTTRKARAIIDEQWETFFNYSQKTYLKELPDQGAWIWMSERSGWNHLYRVDDKTGEAAPITQGEWVVRAVDRVDEKTGQIWFRAMGVYPEQDPYHVHHGRVSLDGTGLTWLTEGDGTHKLQFSPDRAFFLDTYSHAERAPVCEVRRSKDGALVATLSTGDARPLTPRPQRFSAKGRDDETDIWGLIYTPSNLDPATKYPVIEAIYAGPHGQHVPKDFRRWDDAQALAELGFVVVRIDGMGTNWRSKAFHDLCWMNLADAGFPDRILWMEAAAKQRPYMDLTRVGIYGGSAGGQNALAALLNFGHFYDVAVADCGCHDNRMDKMWWNEAWMGWPIGDHYEQQSNITLAHRLEGKLLLTVGEIDKNVDPASTMKVVDALIKADKDFDLIVFPGKGHGAGGSAYGRRRLKDFFVRHLLGVEPRWE